MDPESARGDRALGDPAQWLDEHGEAMFRYAVLHVRNTDAAEDVVQEALLAAWKSRDKFTGRSTLRTWLIGIVRHKCYDYLRRAARQTDVDDIAETVDLLEGQFTDAGHWRVKPSKWGRNPAAWLESREFWDVFDRCMAGLPQRAAQVYILREFDGLAVDEICQIMNATATNVWTMLHRARGRLRSCLEERWFRRE